MGTSLTAAVILLAAASQAAGQPRAATADAAGVTAGIDAQRDVYADVSMQIWNFAEVGYQETQSSALLQARLRAAGFTVQSGVAEIPTAFVATYGSGKPVIGVLGEFDALPGLSQKAVPDRQPVTGGAPGHGCGHHLFGTASMAAAIVVKDWLNAGKRTGTIRFYGTPAEEGGAGKVYMLRAGLFDDVDAVVSWHPGDRNQAGAASTLANINAKFRFRGVSAHAAGAPEKGRSALDGVLAMTHMVEMLREHVPSDTRIHYVITNGGAAPNVVPDFAEVYVYARHNDMAVLDGIWERIVAASAGAAMGTGTTVEHEVMGAVYNMMPNEYLAAIQHRNLQRVGGVVYDADERAFAEKLRTTLQPPILPLGSETQVQQPRTEVGNNSTDTGDVSWNVPTVQLTAATWVPGTPAHSWQAVAAGGTSIGTKGMLVAAKTMALTALELFTEPSHIQRAKAELEQRRAGHMYKSRIGGRKPPLDYRKTAPSNQ
jgi:aminobenzoyl-glutamate utilization protein B